MEIWIPGTPFFLRGMEAFLMRWPISTVYHFSCGVLPTSGRYMCLLYSSLLCFHLHILPLIFLLFFVVFLYWFFLLMFLLLNFLFFFFFFNTLISFLIIHYYSQKRLFILWMRRCLRECQLRMQTILGLVFKKEFFD